MEGWVNGTKTWLTIAFTVQQVCEKKTFYNLDSHPRIPQNTTQTGYEKKETSEKKFE